MTCALRKCSACTSAVDQSSLLTKKASDHNLSDFTDRSCVSVLLCFASMFSYVAFFFFFFFFFFLFFVFVFVFFVPLLSF